MKHMESLGRFLLRQRVAVLIVILAATGYFGYHASKIRVESPIIDLFPSTHEYVETFKKYSNVFGGASRVVIQLETLEGDIFNLETLNKIRRITKALELVPGINNYQVLSLAQRKVKALKVDAERGFKAVPIMWPKIPQTVEEIESLKHSVFTNRRIYGTLVSLDNKATLIVGGFFEKKLNPKVAYDEIEKIIAKERDQKTAIQVIGRPILLGTILSQYPQLIWFFFLTVASILAVLMMYFRDLRGVIVPLCTAIISAIWGIGFLSWLGHNFDPLVIVVPFIISARALSHSVQMVKRYIEEYVNKKDKIAAATATFTGLFKPGVLAIVTDAAGVLLVWTTHIPLLEKLAIMGGYWVISILVSDMLFNPIFLSFLPAPKLGKTEKKSWLESMLAGIARMCLGWQRNVILGITVVVFVIGFFFAQNLVVGDVHPGTPMLWPDSKYNLDTDRIAEKFRNTEEFTVIVEGESRDAIKDPKVLLTMEAFQRHMESIPEVGATSSLADLLPGIISILHSSDPKWELVPENKRDAGFFLEMIYSSSEPGDLVRFVTIDSQTANITMYLKDHKGETLRKVVEHAREFIEANPVDNVKFRLAGGYGGLLAAINEEVTKHRDQVTILAFSIIFIFCALAYRSILAGLLFLVPLAVSNYLTYALMGARNIGLDVNALPVIAVGVGLGVDYGLYIIGRIQEEYRKSQDMTTAITIALRTAGKAVIFTASTMVFGVIFWSFSFLRFQADMGILLLFWMVVSMLGGLILLPALVAMIKPKFITRPVKS
jgi:predicted RND superfamily exporter protein